MAGYVLKMRYISHFVLKGARYGRLAHRYQLSVPAAENSAENHPQQVEQRDVALGTGEDRPGAPLAAIRGGAAEAG